MRIGIDARFYGPEGTGIGRYVEKLLENLELIDSTNDYFVFLRSANFHLYNPKKANFHKLTADARWYGIKEQVIMPAVLSRQKLDLAHFPHFNVPLLYPGKFVVTIHDLTKSHFGSRAASTRSLPVYLTKRTVYKLTLQQALRRSKRILVPSKYVKKEIVKQFGVLNTKIEVTHEAVGLVPKAKLSEGRVKEIFNKYAIRPPYIIYVGNTFPYKNVEKVLEAFLEIDPSVQFVCISVRNKFLDNLVEKAQDLGLRDRFITPGFLVDEDVRLLLSRAEALVHPSLSEGFGLTGLEAMASDCPVVAAEATSLPEIYGEAVLYFDPQSPKAITEALTKILKSRSLREELRRKGRSQVQRYSWRTLAEKTLKVYKEAYGKK